MKITRADLLTARKRRVWIFGNKVLYDLCRNYPLHSNDDVIIAKILLIGRVYAAAIERRKPDKQKAAKKLGDDFYINIVAPKIRKSRIDAWLALLPVKLSPVPESLAINRILDVHGRVTKLFSEISGLEKRSLASKYLHFHRPDLFFIYDSRAVTGIRNVTPSLSFISTPPQDSEYAKFYRRCLWLCADRKFTLSDPLTPRHLDDLLITLAERKK
jgi:hypothetical protein